MADIFAKFEKLWKIIWEFLYATVLSGLKIKE